MSKKFKCLLFDLDGTLVSTGGAGIRALEDAFYFLHGKKGCAKNIKPAGKTDPIIIHEIYLDILDRNCTEKEMEILQKEYLKRLKGECEQADDYKVIKGVQKLLDKLVKMDVVLGLGTGNLEEGAKIKLTRADLNKYFPFGGFGSDSEERDQLLKVGFERAQKHSEMSLDPVNTFIIGDTEKDILAAKKAKFKVIATATGSMSVDALKKYEPDYVLPGFEDQEAFINIIS